jgi:hypothetical protein
MKTISFFKNTQMSQLADYIAGLTRQGLTFEIRDLGSKVEVVLTGGF